MVSQPPRFPLPLSQYQAWMDWAIALARQAGAAGEIPVGAVLLDGNHQLLATGENRKERERDPTAHAEMVAIRQGCRRLQDWHLTDCTLVVTLEPCPMCAGALLQARLGLLIYGAAEPKTGAIATALNLPASAAALHRLKVVGGIREQECQNLLQDWFRQQRQPRAGDRTTRFCN
ncbi:MAG: tRNA adenosine(34) deaminase TadA [Pseudanabaenaceae cyanobacterium]